MKDTDQTGPAPGRTPAAPMAWVARTAPFCLVQVSGPPPDGLGYSLAEWTSPGFLERLCHSEDWDRLGAALAEGAGHPGCDFRARRLDGAWLWLRMGATARLDEGTGPRLLGTFSALSAPPDMSDTPLRERLLLRILGNTHDRLSRLAGPDGHGDAAMREVCAPLLERLDAAGDLWNAVNGTLRLTQGWFDAAALVRAILPGLRPRAEAARIEMHVDVSAMEGFEHLGDARRVRRIVLALVGNVLDHAGPCRLTLSLSPLDAVRGTGIRITVSDTGMGLCADQLERAWLQGTDGAESAGYGLAVVRALVTAFGGEFRIDSNRGTGTRVTVALPLEARCPGTAATDSDPGQGPRVLCVDDTPSNAFILAQFLRRLGVAADTVDSGAAAVRAALEGPAPALILMDVQMEPMDGLQATRAIRAGEVRQGRQRVPIVAVTTQYTEADCAIWMTSGMDGHIAKPARLPQIRAVLEEFGVLPTPADGPAMTG